MALMTVVDKVNNAKPSERAAVVAETRRILQEVGRPALTIDQTLDVISRQPALARTMLLKQTSSSLTALATSVAATIGGSSSRGAAELHKILATLKPVPINQFNPDAISSAITAYRTGRAINPTEIGSLYQSVQNNLKKDIISRTSSATTDLQQLASWQRTSAVLSVVAAHSGNADLQKAANVVQSGVQLYSAAVAVLAVSTGWGAVLALPALLQSGQSFASAFGGQNNEDRSEVILKVLVPMLEKISKQIEGLDRKIDLLMIDVGQLASDNRAMKEKLDLLSQKMATLDEVLRTQDRIFELAQKTMIRELQGMSVDGCLRARTTSLGSDSFNSCLDAFVRIARTSTTYPHQAASLTVDDAYDTLIARLVAERGTFAAMPGTYDWLEAFRIVLTADLAKRFEIPASPLPNPSVMYGSLQGYVTLASIYPQYWQSQLANSLRDEIAELDGLIQRYSIFANGIGKAKRHGAFQDDSDEKTVRETLIRNYVRASTAARNAIKDRLERITIDELGERTNRKAASEILGVNINKCTASTQGTGRTRELYKGPNVALDPLYLLQVENSSSQKNPLLPLTICADIVAGDINQIRNFPAVPPIKFRDLEGCDRLKSAGWNPNIPPLENNPHLLFRYTVKYKVFLGDQQVVSGEWTGDGWAASYYICHNRNRSRDLYRANDAWELFFISNDTGGTQLSEHLKGVIINAANAKVADAKKLIEREVRENLLGPRLASVLQEEVDYRRPGLGAAMRQLDGAVAALRAYALIAMRDTLVAEKGWAELLFGSGPASLFTSRKLRYWANCFNTLAHLSGPAEPTCAADFELPNGAGLRAPSALLENLSNSTSLLLALSERTSDTKVDGASLLDDVFVRLEVARAALKDLDLLK